MDEVQEANGEYWMLRADIDMDEAPTTINKLAEFMDIMLDGNCSGICATMSAIKNTQNSKVLILSLNFILAVICIRRISAYSVQ